MYQSVVGDNRFFKTFLKQARRVINGIPNLSTYIRPNVKTLSIFHSVFDRKKLRGEAPYLGAIQ